MECEDCGEYGDWVGEASHWDRVGERSATRPLYECDNCGNRQQGR